MSKKKTTRSGSLNVTTFRITSSLLWAFVPKRTGSNDMVHGKCHSGYIFPCWLGNGRGSVCKVLMMLWVMCVCLCEADKHLYMVGTRV